MEATGCKNQDQLLHLKQLEILFTEFYEIDNLQYCPNIEILSCKYDLLLIY